VLSSAVSHIPNFRDAASRTRDGHLPWRWAYLPKDIWRLPREMPRHLQISGYVTLLGIETVLSYQLSFRSSKHTIRYIPRVISLIYISIDFWYILLGVRARRIQCFFDQDPDRVYRRALLGVDGCIQVFVFDYSCLGE